MNITKRYDLSVVVATYQDGEGRKRKRFQTIGTLCETDTGPIIFLNATFNPAAVPRSPDQAAIIVSCYPQDDAPEREDF